MKFEKNTIPPTSCSTPQQLGESSHFLKSDFFGQVVLIPMHQTILFKLCQICQNCGYRTHCRLVSRVLFCLLLVVVVVVVIVVVAAVIKNKIIHISHEFTSKLSSVNIRKSLLFILIVSVSLRL